VLFVRVSLFLRRRFPVHSTGTVEASTVYRGVVVHHRLVIHIVNLGHVDVIHRPVVVEIIPPPISAFIAFSHVSIAIIYPAIETDVRSPVTCIPYVHSVVPSPISRRPQEAGRRRKHPCTGYPVIIFIVIAISPVAGRPDIIVAGTNRLYVDWQGGWRDSNGYSNDLPEQ
jgi:hypothetical protein